MAVSPGPVPSFLSEREILENFARVSHSTLWRWVRAGVFPPPIRIGPRRIFWKACDIEAWAATLPIAPAYRRVAKPANHR
jgi:prophage regulatory protein